ncbi:MAG TPA: efflux RND transporter periplasmic adaptor subunit [Cyclobacteriaceae bacterium]|nr:efflux RND transporter periplasmic adaptor subunit [Cyclobacteriaceae bacterium]
MTTSCSQNKKQAEAGTYTCSMHPTVVQRKPGTCPVCGMDLVLKGKQGNVKITADLNYLLRPVNATVISSIKTIMPVQKAIDVKLEANGIITYDMRSLVAISTRFSGRIEKLFVNYNFQPVKKGQGILEIYSPELLTAQRDLLYLLKSDKENSQLIEGAKEKLRILGASDLQIDRLIATRRESNSFIVYSSASGYMIEPQNSINQSELQVRAGMYVNAGQTIFQIAAANSVWAEFDIYSKDVPAININDPLPLSLDGVNDAVEGRINFIQPFYKNGENFTKVRAFLPNTYGRFRVGQWVRASFDKSIRESRCIPVSAQLDLGTKKVVFIRRGGIFQSREIITGRSSGGWIEVLKGIEAGDSIAYNAQFMVDSESFIKIKN